MLRKLALSPEAHGELQAYCRELGIEFLNRIGQSTHDLHNEGILFSDAIGFSTLVCLLNNGDQGNTETAQSLLGPFWRLNSPVTENGGSIVRCETPGPALLVDAARVTLLELQLPVSDLRTARQAAPFAAAHAQIVQLLYATARDAGTRPSQIGKVLTCDFI